MNIISNSITIILLYLLCNNVFASENVKDTNIWDTKIAEMSFDKITPDQAFHNLSIKSEFKKVALKIICLFDISKQGEIKTSKPYYHIKLQDCIRYVCEVSNLTAYYSGSSCMVLDAKMQIKRAVYKGRVCDTDTQEPLTNLEIKAELPRNLGYSDIVINTNGEYIAIIPLMFVQDEGHDDKKNVLYGKARNCINNIHVSSPGYEPFVFHVEGDSVDLNDSNILNINMKREERLP